MKLENKTVLAKDKLAQSSSSSKSFRMAHDKTKVVALFKSNGETWTIGELFCATTEQECLDEISKLNLKYKPDHKDKPF